MRLALLVHVVLLLVAGKLGGLVEYPDVEAVVMVQSMWCLCTLVVKFLYANN